MKVRRGNKVMRNRAPVSAASKARACGRMQREAQKGVRE